jgi:hypothetical protein
VVETPIVEAKVEAVASVIPVKEEFKGLPVRSGGDRIWLLKGGKKHWIRNAEVFSKLGFKFGDEREIDFDTLNALVEGEPISE